MMLDAHNGKRHEFQNHKLCIHRAKNFLLFVFNKIPTYIIFLSYIIYCKHIEEIDQNYLIINSSCYNYCIPLKYELFYIMQQSMINQTKGNKFMKDNKTSHMVAKGIKHILNGFLRLDANSTSCVVMYQPKQPDMSRFKKNR